MQRLSVLLILAMVVWAGPVAAQKPTPPPTPAPVAPTAVVEPPAPPTKAPEPPTPTPEPLPAATSEPLPPTSTNTVVPPTATADVPTAMPGAPTATLPRPTTTGTATPTVVVTTTISVAPTANTAATLTQWPTLPGWVWPVAGGVGVLILWLIVRFVGYTRQDLAMKRRMIAEDAAARVAAHRRDVAARLQDTDAWWHILGQIATDALNTPVRIAGDTLPHIDGDALAFTVLDHQGVSYCFTVATPRKRQAGGQVYRLDNPETQAEVSAVWHYLAAQRLQGTIPAVPRQTTWVLVVQRPVTLLARRKANRRWWLGALLCIPLLAAASTLVGARLVQARLATPVTTAVVTLVNATDETVSVWTLEETSVCVVCPEAAMSPQESRALTVTPGPILWEVVAVPYGDFYTAYRVGLVESYVQSGATTRDTVITLTKMPLNNGR